MPAPRINPNLMSATMRANLAKVQSELNFGNREVRQEVSPESKQECKKTIVRKKKETLTPDKANSLVKSVTVSEDGNEVKIILAVDGNGLPTAQQKGAFVGKDGRVHFFTKSKIAKAGKALKIALSPYAHLTSKWGRVPIQLTFDAYFPYPSSTPKKDRHKIGPHTERPDGDNLLKLPADVMTEAGFWEDDSLIGTYIIRKRRTTGPACISIKVTNLAPKFEALYRDTEEYETPSLLSKTSSQPTETNPLSELNKHQLTQQQS